MKRLVKNEISKIILFFEIAPIVSPFLVANFMNEVDPASTSVSLVFNSSVIKWQSFYMDECLNRTILCEYVNVCDEPYADNLLWTDEILINYAGECFEDVLAWMPLLWANWCRSC